MVICYKNIKKTNVHLPLKRRDIWAAQKNILSTRVLKSLWFRHVQGQDISWVNCNLNFKKKMLNFSIRSFNSKNEINSKREGKIYQRK